MKNLPIIFNTLQIFLLQKLQLFTVLLQVNHLLQGNLILYVIHLLIIGKYPTLIGMKNLLIIFSTLQIFQLPKIQPFNVYLVGNSSLKGDLSFAEKLVFYGLNDLAYLLTK